MRNEFCAAPVGAEEVVSVLAEVCANGAAHKHCGIAPPHFVINLDAGNGQTTITRYISETLSKNEIRHFGGMDPFLEYILDGTMTQLKQVFGDIHTCAVYTNNFEGVVAIDITALSKYANEAQAEFFLEEIKKVCRTATVILYTGGIPSRGVLSVINKLKATVHNVSIIHLDTYTPDELVCIAERLLDEYGVSGDASDEFHNALREVVTLEACQTVKDTMAVTERAVKMADFSGYVPTLSTQQLKLAFTDIFASEKGEGR